MKKVGIGLIGFGTIGAGLIKIIQQEKQVELKYVADLDIATPRSVEVNKSLLTTDANRVLNDPSIDIIVELMGGIQPAKKFILDALKNKKHVVTANKALLATHGDEIFQAAKDNNVYINFEASVGGGIPIIKALRDSFRSSDITSVLGIINGTSNFILSKMSLEKQTFASALKEAQGSGYAEADASLDIDGIDSAHKIAILSSIIYRTRIDMDHIYVEGIKHITLEDIQYAEELGYVIKPLAIANRDGNRLDVRVHPALISKEHSLSSVSDVYNAIYLCGNSIGKMMFYGLGAGQMPTANAVYSDIIDISGKTWTESSVIDDYSFTSCLDIKETAENRLRYYIRFSAVDKPGVLAKISGILGRCKISITSVIQKDRKQRGAVPIIMMTHEAKEKDIYTAIREIDKLDIIKRKSVIIRVED
ncbi:homoserine dehydrogenase [bacterium]|nr:homoserine dehydrogenase [bacterium]